MTGMNPTPLTFQDQSGRSGQSPEGSRAARLLHMVRRVERNLMSYERTGGGTGGHLESRFPGQQLFAVSLSSRLPAWMRALHGLPPLHVCRSETIPPC